MGRMLLVLIGLCLPLMAQAQGTNADGSRTYNGVTKGGRGGTTTAPSTRSTAPTRSTPAPPRVDPFDVKPWFIADLGLGMLGGAIGAAGTGQGMTRARFGRNGDWGIGLSTAFSANGGGFLSETDVGPVYHLEAPMLQLAVQPSVLINAGSRGGGLGLGVRAYGTLDLGRVGVHLDPLLGQGTNGFVYNLKAGVSYRFTPTIHGRISYDNRGILGAGTGPMAQLGAHGVVATVGVRF